MHNKKHQMFKEIGLGLCLVTPLFLLACGDATATPNAMLPAAQATPSPKATATSNPNQANPAALTPPISYTWLTFRSKQADFSVEYPTSWTANEHSEEGGVVITDFQPGNGIGIGIQVVTTPRSENDTQNKGDDIGGGDLPNTRCQRVTVGGIAAKRCFDTISFSTSTTLTAATKVYRISSQGKKLDETIYEHFLDTLRFVPSRSVP